jgi:hypothetical protein
MNFSTSLRVGLSLTTACLTAGCFAVAYPMLEDIGTMGNNLGGGFSGLAGTESTVKVNKSWIDFNALAMRSTRMQMALTQKNQRELALNRNTTLGILRDVKDAEGGNPQIANLIDWVNAGGNPEVALTYALNSEAQQQKEAKLRQTTIGLLEGIADQPQADPNLPILIAWVRAGGDPRYALNYAITHAQPPAEHVPAHAPQPPTHQGLSSR